MKYDVAGTVVDVSLSEARALERIRWDETASGVVFTVALGGRVFEGHVHRVPGGYSCWMDGEVVVVRRAGADGPSDQQGVWTPGPLRAPFACRLLALHVRQGQTVQEGDPLYRIESMKMEQVVSAPGAATVVEVAAEAGTTLARDQVVLRLGPANEGDGA